METEISLKEAFELFSRESKRLEQSYEKLELEFAKLNNRLASSDSTLQAIVSNINCGLIFVSKEGMITVFNKGAEEILAISSQSVIGKPFQQFFADELLGFSMQEALLQTKVDHTFVTLQNNTFEKEIEVSLSPMKDGLIIMLRDISELKKLQKIVNHHERLKDLGVMAAVLAHEIRNPLGGIEGFASLLAHDLKDSPHLRTMAESICEGARDLNHLVTNVLLYSKPLEIHLTKVSLLELLKSHQKYLRFKKEHASIFVLADKTHLQRALLNVIQNAVDAAKKEVEIFIQRVNKKVHICIQNDGELIKEEHMEKIFTPFFTTKTKGTGLGLCEANKILEAHGGEIILTRTPKTCFTLVLQEENGH